MAYEDPQLLHEDKFLTEISVAYDQDAEFIGNRLSPAIPVDKQSDKYRVFNRDNAARVTQDFRAPGSRANELPPMMVPGKDTYFAEEHALKDVVPREEQQNADPEYNPEAEATERLTETILLNREYTLIQLVLATANYATGHSVTLSGVNQWSDYANSDPSKDIKTARFRFHKSMLGREPNTVVMGWEVAWHLEDHPKFLDRIKQRGDIKTTDQIIADILRVPNFIRAARQYNTAPYGAAENMQDLWGRDVLLAWVPARPGRRTPSYMYEFNWRYPSGASMPTERWFDEDRDSDIVRVRRRYDLKFISIDGTGKSIGGYLVKNAVAVT